MNEDLFPFSMKLSSQSETNFIIRPLFSSGNSFRFWWVFFLELKYPVTMFCLFLGMAIEDSMAAKLVLDLHSGKMDT